jgi:hypothetical protein
MEGGLSLKSAAASGGKERGCFLEKLSPGLLFYDGLPVSVTGRHGTYVLRRHRELCTSRRRSAQ